MVTKTDDAPSGQARGRRSEQQLAMPFSNLTDLTTWKPTLEPIPATCAFCGGCRNLYQMGDKWICMDHIGAVVSLAANDVFSDCVFYSAAFEKMIL